MNLKNLKSLLAIFFYLYTIAHHAIIYEKIGQCQEKRLCSTFFRQMQCLLCQQPDGPVLRCHVFFWNRIDGQVFYILTFYNRSNLIKKNQDLTSSELFPDLRTILISATFHCGGMKHYRKIELYKYMRKVNSLSGRFFRIVAITTSSPVLFIGFGEFITVLISYFEYLNL